MTNFKEKKCKDCKEVFQPFRFAQPRCVPCAIIKGKADTAKQICNDKKKAKKEFNAETRSRKRALKGKSEYKKEAQAAFNAFIRQRDIELPCISCDRKPNDNGLVKGSRWDAGHYRSRGANLELAFVEENVHKQCTYCNRDLSGNAINYRINLVKKIGQARVDWLEGPHELPRYTIDDYQAIKKKYRQKLRDMTK